MIDIKRFRYFYYYLIILISLLLDLFLAHIMHQHIIYLMLCWYCIALLKNNSPIQIGYTLFLLLLQQSIIDGQYGMTLLYLIPTSFIGIIIRNWVHPQTTIGFYIFLCINLLAQFTIIDFWIRGLPGSIACTLFKIFANILIMFIILKLSRGRQGNRFNVQHKRGKSGLLTTKYLRRGKKLN